MSHWYQIDLLPLGPYFFGQEQVAELGNRQSYFKRSAAFPQQSTLLGMLRHQLLLQHGLAIPRVATDGNPTELIGSIGFKPNANPPSYGKIEGLGPVFLQKGGKGRFFIRDREWIQDKEKVSTLEIGGELPMRGLGTPTKMLPGLTVCPEEGGKHASYTGKDYFGSFLHDPREDGQTRVPTGKALGEVVAVGVYKYVTREVVPGDNEEGYYKNVYQWMQPGWSFGFHARLEDDKSLGEGGYRTVIMGKERSIFLISVTRINGAPIFGGEEAVPGRIQKVLLLSDAWVDESRLLPLCRLINGETVRFRAITKPFQAQAKKWFSSMKRADRSSSWNLLKRGTIIYTDRAAEVSELLRDARQWYTIGNNYHLILPA